ncbi:MAG: type transport system ATP-binding protein [Chloroflexota bacterium]|jgi:ABC-2 type transport system ATP-binding protein|nr:type transport system ATP-binding protein [Chloroflexota bacterium]
MTLPDMPALEAHDVAKRYGRREPFALRGLDVEVAPGSITALVGPNGAGKSTLIKAWVGFERPSRGAVRTAGHDPFRERAAVLRAVAYVPQTSALYREWTVADHIDFVKSASRRFEPTVARARLSDLAIDPRKLVARLSGGQQAQVSLALALGLRSSILLLDEPLASLDPLARRDFLHVLRDDVVPGGRTAVLSSHVVSDIAQACDRLIVLREGEKVLDSGIGEAVENHRVTSASDGDEIVGTFRTPAGGLVSLTTGAGAAATLEEVVLGYLASGRRTPTGYEPTDPALPEITEVLGLLARDPSGGALRAVRPDLTEAQIATALEQAALRLGDRAKR